MCAQQFQQQPQSSIPSNLPKSTLHRQKKGNVKPRTSYNCKKCGKTARGHGWYKGKRYCPLIDSPGMTYEQWLEKQRSMDRHE